MIYNLSKANSKTKANSKALQGFPPIIILCRRYTVLRASVPSTHQSVDGTSILPAWEIERVKAPWTAFQARAITKSREK